MVTQHTRSGLLGQGHVIVRHHVEMDDQAKSYTVVDEVYDDGIGAGLGVFRQTYSGVSVGGAGAGWSKGKISRKETGVRVGPHGPESYTFDTATGRLLVHDVAQAAGWTTRGNGTNVGLVVGLVTAGVAIVLVLALLIILALVL